MDDGGDSSSDLLNLGKGFEVFYFSMRIEIDTNFALVDVVAAKTLPATPRMRS
jgi:hypothetical protein